MEETMINRSLKSILFIALLGYALPFMAMDTKNLAGTVIDPINYSGQCTVNAFQAPSGPSFDIAGNAQELAKIKGLPVIVSIGASHIPWWALTTGTGFLLLTQANIADPLLLQVALDGLGYVAGETVAKNIPTISTNKKITTAATAALITALYATSYACPGIACICTIANAAATTAALQMLTSHAQNLFANKQEPNKQQPIVDIQQLNSTNSSWYSAIAEHYKMAAGLLLGGLGAYALQYQHIKKILEIIDPRLAVKILLYEQAYRLAQAGVQAAQGLFTATPKPLVNPILEV
jgi:hypothetical protein